MPWSNTTTDVGSMGDRKYAYGTAHHSGLLAGTITIPMGRVDNINFEQILYSGTCGNIAINNQPPWGTPATPYQTVLTVNQCLSGVLDYTWFAIGKRG